MKSVDTIKNYYNENVETEWERFERHPFEYQLALRFMDRYIKPGAKVLDVGGGPGRYAIHLAQRGCDVTLFDLAAGNIEFAKEKAAQAGVSLTTNVGDARELDKIVAGRFDHVLLMGPLYHLLDEGERGQAIWSSLKLLRSGGAFFASFISSYAGILYAMKYEPEMLLAADMEPLIKLFIDDKPFAGAGFTEAFFVRQQDVLPFMTQFPLKKLHFFGQEGILAPCEENIKDQPPAVIEKWLAVAEKVCEREDLLSFSEHLMYVGKKL